jgi:prophage regulatory protein
MKRINKSRARARNKVASRQHPTPNTDEGRPQQRDGDRGEASAESSVDKPKFKILTKRQVLARVPISYPTLWTMMKKGLFPRSRELSEERVGWLESEIDSWIENLPIRALGGERKEEEASV